MHNWKVEKACCKDVGDLLTMISPNPLVKKWEWVEVYPPFEGDVDCFNED
jgi:hypothetical protein